MGPPEGDAGLAPTLQGEVPKENEMRDSEPPAESGGKSTDSTEEPVSTSPRLIPIPGSPTNSGEPAFPPITEDSGKTSVPFDQQCAFSQAPECVSGNYDHLSYGQIRDLCKSRAYHKQDANVVRKTRLGAMDAVARQSLQKDENAMETSSPVLGKRDRSLAEPATNES